MKKVILLTVFSFLANWSMACSCMPVATFCEGSNSQYSNIGLFKIISFSSDLVHMEVVLLDSIYGNFEKDTLTVRGQDGLNCNAGLWALTNYDTLVLNIFSDWGYGDTVGISGCFPSALEYQNGIIYGNIEPGVQSKKMTDFKEDLQTCLLMVNTESIIQKPIKIQPNPAFAFIEIQSEVPILNLQMVDLSGRIIMNLQGIHERQKRIEVNHLTNGIYIVRIQNENGIVLQRFVKQ